MAVIRFWWLVIIIFFCINDHQNVLSTTPEISRTHLYTATSDLVKLIKSETKLIDILNDFIENGEQALERMKRYAAIAKQKQTLLLGENGQLMNPIDIYVRFKTFHTFYDELDILSNRTSDGVKILDRLHDKPQDVVGSLLPSEEDLHGAADALFRLQDTYNLKPDEISEGRLKTKFYTETLSASECLELGRIASEELKDHYHALVWFEEAWRKSQTEGENPPTADRREILRYLVVSYRAQGNPERALATARKVLEFDPDYQLAKDMISTLEAELLKANKNQAGDSSAAAGADSRKDQESELPDLVNVRYNDGHLDNRDIYEALCRGEEQDTTDWHKLHCYYKTDTSYSKLAPFKIEVVRMRDPRIVILREIVTDQEVEMLQSLAEPKFFTTANFLKFRVSKSAWVGDEEDELVATLSKRIEQATGLSTKSAEQLHLSCYGIGGHYEPHYDYFRPNEKDDNHTFDYILRSGAGNRIATVLLYLSTPDLGGATVFTNLRLTLYATKNDAAFWYNLHRDGTINPETRHAACPVLVGTKWIGNKWLHERGQEFRYLCNV